MITLNLTIHKFVLNFSDNNQKNCILDIDNYFFKNDWCKNSPPYQTWPVLFERTEKHWIDLKQEINNQISTKYNLCDLNCKAWAYVCFSGETQNFNLNNGWHSHDKINSLYSAIFYLNFNENFESTEFMDENGNVYRPKLEKNMLLCFDSKIVHRPAIWNNKNKQNRYVIAIDYRI